MAKKKTVPGKPRKFTPGKLAAAVQRYFDSISRDIQVCDKVPTGELDRYGHPLFRDEPAYNRLGKPIMRQEFLEPPTVSGLCLALGIHRSTWAEYAKDAEYSDTTTYAQGVMRAWNEQQLLTRSGKDVRGIEFNLSNNFGFRDKVEVELGEQSRKAVAREPMTLEERRRLLEEIASEWNDGEGG